MKNLQEKMENASITFDFNDRENTITEVLSIRPEENLIIAMEELSELIKEISKNLRNKGNYINTCEEIVDVEFALSVIKQYVDTNENDLNKIRNLKLDYLKESLKKEV